MKTEKPKIIDSLWAFLVATAVMGPFALPLLWRNPRYSQATKILASIAVIGFTLWLIYFGKQILDAALDDAMKNLDTL